MAVNNVNTYLWRNFRVFEKLNRCGVNKISELENQDKNETIFCLNKFFMQQCVHYVLSTSSFKVSIGTIHHR